LHAPDLDSLDVASPDAPDIPPPTRLVEDLMGCAARVLVVHTPSAHAVLKEFRRVARLTGKSIYRYTEEVGIHSLKDGDFIVPGSKRLPDALRYIQQSMHYGIYLLDDISSSLRQPNLGLLRQLGRARTGNDRKVILIGSDLRIPAALAESVMQFTHQHVLPTRPRLRDGKWVL
jgi:hypothetical protein